jgi:hypothetical protein
MRNRARETCELFQALSSLPADSLDCTDDSHPIFPVQGHVLSVGGDALMGSDFGLVCLSTSRAYRPVFSLGSFFNVA